jgi:hypothetical protein
MHKNLTPSNLRCGVMSSCPSINQLEDGRLLIVGTYSPARARLNNVPMGEDETAIVISPEYLSDYISQHVDAAVRAERREIMSRLGYHETGECIEEEKDRDGLVIITIDAAGDNLDAAIYDLKRTGADSVCISTCEKVHEKIQAVVEYARSRGKDNG